MPHALFVPMKLRWRRGLKSRWDHLFRLSRLNRRLTWPPDCFLLISSLTFATLGVIHISRSVVNDGHTRGPVGARLNRVGIAPRHQETTAMPLPSSGPGKTEFGPYDGPLMCLKSVAREHS